MQRKVLIAVVIIAIVLVGILGWYFLLQPQPAPEVPLKVFIDGNPYATPFNWTRTATGANGTMVESDFHRLSNEENASMRVSFNFTVWHRNTASDPWTEEYNGTQWLVEQTAITTLVSAANQTAVFRTVFAENKTGERSTYHVTLTYNNNMTYVKFEYPGNDPTVDGETIFAYLAFDGNGNKAIDGDDKAFNFTHNPHRAEKNQLKVYTSLSGGWNTTATSYGWNENVSTGTPITIVLLNDGKTITWAIPFTYVGAQQDRNLGFFFQAYGYNWGVSGADPTKPDKFIGVTLSLPETLIFTIDTMQTVRFFVRVWFSSKASGDYSFLFNASPTAAR